MQESNPIETVSEWIAEAKKIIVFTGAGVSTESGIPDFRSPGGLWDRYDPDEFRFRRFLESEETRRKYWKMHTELYGLLTRVRPNVAHEACVELDRLDKLECVITQNVDNLHTDAGLAPEKVIELHGNALQVGCLECDARHPRAEVQGWLEAGSAIRFVTPDDRHFGRDREILAQRRRVYEEARKRHPERWTGDIRNWEPIGAVTLNPDPRHDSGEIMNQQQKAA